MDGVDSVFVEQTESDGANDGANDGAIAKSYHFCYA